MRFDRNTQTTDQMRSEEEIAEKMTEKYVTYRGSCHCKKVTFTFEGNEELVGVKCNCSICAMKGNVHTVVPNSRFHLLTGKDNLTLYTFNTHTAKHYFCQTCGVQSFYIPRSNPDGYAVTIACVENLGRTKLMEFNGTQWEESFAQSDIKNYSKE